MQKHNYPLPPLMLIPIIVACAVDHHTSPEAVRILKIEAGQGRHVCDTDHSCRHPTHDGYCLKRCDDSDWIVELEYTAENAEYVDWIDDSGEYREERKPTGVFFTAHAVYGVLDGRHSLWMD